MSILKKITYHRPRSELESKGPNLISKTINLSQAASELIRTRFQVVSEEEEKRRLNICENECPKKYWNPAGNAGLGECMHPKCGCSRLKHKFAVSKCPDDLW